MTTPTNPEELVERARHELAVKNVAAFTLFASSQIAPHQIEDLNIVVSLARAAIDATPLVEMRRALIDCLTDLQYMESVLGDKLPSAERARSLTGDRG